MPTITGYQPSARVERLRERALAQPSELFLPVVRSYYFLEGWMSEPNATLPVRTAAGLANVIENMPVLAFADDILVGENGDSQCDWLVGYGPVNPKDFEGAVAASSLTEAQQKRMMGWLEERPFHFATLAPGGRLPQEVSEAQEHGLISVWGTALNHSIRDYEKVLRLGFSGIAKEIEEAYSEISWADPASPIRRGNLEGFLRICRAAEKLGVRHAAKARELAEAASDANEAREWTKIAEVCDRVPAAPARTFREAVQALHFAHMITVWEDGINANGIGRIDQFLWPYLERDLAAGTTTREEACEILAALWSKLYRPYDVQQMMVGGLHPDGSDATNPLSMMVLDVTEALGFIRCLSARVHRESPREFVARCVDLVARGGGIPFFFNDEALVPALVSRGVPLEDARGYAAIGCVEITIPGKAFPHAVSNWINLPKCLELAMNDGKDMLDGTQLGPRTGPASAFASMDDVLEAYTLQLEHFAALAVHGSNSLEIAHRSQFRTPYLSILTSDCIAKGLDIIEGGASYNYHSSAAVGIPNAADSLAAVRRAVFDDRTLTMGELVEALRSDFKDNEDLRLRLRNRAPKYGNDEDLPDSYAADLTRQYCDLLAEHRTASGGKFFCHLFTFTLMLPLGKLTAASPEGRHAGEPLAYSVSPAQGRDKEGLTAVMNSLSKLPHFLAAASSSAIVEVDPGLLEGSSREAFVDLLVTAIAKGVGQLQFNVVSADTLRKAQEDPDRYRSLCVRVSGFSQQFCLLDREMQDHIIARTKHKR